MKKFIGIILCVSIIISSCSLIVTAAQNEDTPLIIVPGFLQPFMFIEGEGEAEDEYLWLPKRETFVAQLVDEIPDFISAGFSLATGDVEGFGSTMGGTAYAIAHKLRCNPDGSSVYPVTHYKNDPAEANAENLRNTVSRDAERKNFLFEDFVDYAVENGYAELEDIFIFEYDSRHDPIMISEELRQYIKDVKEYTGSDKVNLFTVSYGGLITATYFYYYMNDGDVNKAVLNVPPLQGTDFTDRLFRKNVDLPFETIIDFVESVLGSGTEIASFFEANDGDFLNTTLNEASEGMLDVVQYWSSIYTITSPDLYDAMKRDFLDAEESAPIIRNNDIIHYEIMPSMKEIFDDCIENGIDVSIITCTGCNICFGGELNGDILVPTYSASGAYCADFGKRFADGYEPKMTTCDDPSHNHVSPSMEVDASCAYLPENTWFIEGSYHAMFEIEDYAAALCAKLVFTDELESVHSDPDFPQFEYSDNPHRGIYAKFNSSLSGYVSSADTALYVKNIYSGSDVILTSIDAYGMDIDFDLPSGVRLAPGESVEIPFSGDIPKVSATRTDITVNYVKTGLPLAATSVNIPMTICNGDAPGSSGGFVDTDPVTALEAALPEAIFDLLTRLSLRKTFESLYSLMLRLF